jgi:hypothetical protein
MTKDKLRKKFEEEEGQPVKAWEGWIGHSYVDWLESFVLKLLQEKE